MAHLAMFGVNAVSHTLPSLEILRELVVRGHRVSVVNDPDQRELVEATGAELVPCRSILPTGAWPEDPIAAMRLFLDDAIQGLDQVREHFDAEPADLYLADIGGFGGRVLAETHGRPFVLLSPTFVAWEGYADEVGSQIRALPGAADYLTDFRAWLERSGATTTDPGDFTGVPPRALALVPRAMQPHADRVDSSRITFVGPCPGERTEQGPGSVRMVPPESSSSPSGRATSRSSTGSVWRPSVAARGGTSCCRSAGGSTSTCSASSLRGSRCTAGSHS